MAHAAFPGFAAFLRDLANSTAAVCGSRASTDCASSAYSREIDMQARRKTSLTACEGVGMVVGFIGAGCVVVHALTVYFFAQMNESCRVIKHVEGCSDAV